MQSLHVSMRKNNRYKDQARKLLKIKKNWENDGIEPATASTMELELYQLSYILHFC